MKKQDNDFKTLYTDEQLIIFSVIIKVVEGELPDDIKVERLGKEYYGWISTIKKEDSKTTDRKKLPVAYIYLGDCDLSVKEKTLNFISGSIYLIDYLMCVRGIKVQKTKNGVVNSVTEIRSYCLTALIDNFTSFFYRDKKISFSNEKEFSFQDDIITGKKLTIKLSVPEDVDDPYYVAGTGRYDVDTNTIYVPENGEVCNKRLGTLVHEINHFIDNAFLEYEDKVIVLGNDHSDIKVTILKNLIERVVLL